MDQLKAYEPTWRERAASGLQDMLMSRFGMSAYDAMKMAQKVTGGGQGAVGGMGLLDVTPAGLAFGAQEGGLQAGQGAARAAGGDVGGGLLGMGLGALSLAGAPVGKPAAAAGRYAGVSKAPKRIATVVDPERVSFPGIYDNPRELVSRAKVAPEDPIMKELFGVTRDDLFAIAQQGKREGNITDVPYKVPEGAKGARHASQVMNPRNTQRLQDIIGEAEKRPDLYKGMASWYTMDPLFKRFEEIYGPNAVAEYNRFNTLTGMASPGSEVLTELNRGTAANWLDAQGRFDDFKKFGGVAEAKRGARFPNDMRGVMGHAYHSTAQAVPMEKYLSGGVVDMGSAKVPSYIAASGVPETGFQTAYPVGDAHWSRLVGLPDVRGRKTSKGVEVIPGASASVAEMNSLTPWWQDKIAAPMGLQSVPAQAVVWGAGANATGVTSPIGAPKLELLAQQIAKAAERMGVSPATARDMIIRRQGHAGLADPELLAALAAAGGATALGAGLLSDE